MLPKSSKSKYTLLSPYLATTAPALVQTPQKEHSHQYQSKILNVRVLVYLVDLGLKLWREGLMKSLDPARELPPSPLTVADG